MKRKKWLLGMVAFICLFHAACNDDEGGEPVVDEEAKANVNETGFPIAKETEGMDFFVGKSLTNVNADWNDLMIFNEYEEMTNVDITWDQIPGDSLEEKRNLALAGGELPDVFFATRMPSSDLLKYGKQGTFIPLNDFIEQYAPNFKKLMDENPEIKKAITFPDGNIYSLPNLYDPEFTSLVMNATPWIDQSWLDELGMEMPQTTDEFYEFLTAAKGKDFNGNGEVDESPFGAYAMTYLTRWLRGSFGIGNKGVDFIDLDPETEKVRFYAMDERYKALLEYLNKLYSEGLINQNIYSIEFNQFLTDAQAGKYGSTVWYTPPMEFGEAGQDFVGAPALEGPYGDKLYADVSHPVASLGQFVVTSENPNPAAAVRWVDYFYGDEGSKFYYMGIEGETYEVAEDGSLKYLDKITNSPDGSTMNEELVKYLAWVGSSSPSIIRQEYFQGTESSPDAIAAGEILKPYFPDEVWSQFTYTVDENREMVALSSDIQKYVNEMTDKFITGEVPFSEWENYVSTLEGMGVEDYLAIQQSAYERTLE